MNKVDIIALIGIPLILFTISNSNPTPSKNTNQIVAKCYSEAFIKMSENFEQAATMMENEKTLAEAHEFLKAGNSTALKDKVYAPLGTLENKVIYENDKVNVPKTVELWNGFSKQLESMSKKLR